MRVCEMRVLTEVIGEVWDRARHVSLGDSFRPDILEIPLSANNRKSGAERDVEACCADDGVDLDEIPSLGPETLGLDAGNGIGDHPNIRLPQSPKIVHSRCQSSTSEWELWDYGIAEALVTSQSLSHVFCCFLLQAGCKGRVLEGLATG